MNDFYHVQSVEWHRAPDTSRLMLSLTSMRNLEGLFRGCALFDGEDPDGSLAEAHCRPAENLYLDRATFTALLVEAGIQVLDEDAADLLYDKVRKGSDVIRLPHFLEWVANADDEHSAFLEERSDASYYASLARTVTTMTRPLAQSLGALVNLVGRNLTVLLAKYAANPVRLFRRVAVGTLEVVGRKRGSLTTMQAVKAEVASGGFYGVARLAIGPYLFNSAVAFTMFHTYTVLKEHLLLQKEDWTHYFTSSNPYVQILKQETFAGGSAGLLQATMNTPVYNIKRKMPGKTISLGAKEIFISHGMRGLFADMPLMCVQETLGLAVFFSSYELMKKALQEKVSHEQRIVSWVVAGMAAGMMLTAVTHPFDNLHEWHVRHHTKKSHPNAMVHFMQHTIRVTGKRHLSIRRILFHGLAKRLPMGIPAGIPLLVYEVMMGHETVVQQVEDFKNSNQKNDVKGWDTAPTPAA
eukprot:TRINITY_DN26091_c0_g1_i1.p2 TRINITY_DN26091_c0_g1~~TRINITY_DN26091_c0_g1_i1.p2  ORF type:complete len:467 (+),score=166.90 TRINITY_DN26091_c0_g1_i1:109-1509(+)